MAARSPCFTRWWLETCVDLTNSSHNARGRPCVLSSRSACATGTDSIASRSGTAELCRGNAKWVSPNGFEQNQTALWQLEETAKARRSAFPSRNEVLQGHTPRYFIPASSLVFRLDRLLSFGTTLAETCLFVFQAATIPHSGPLAASSTHGRRHCSFGFAAVKRCASLAKLALIRSSNTCLPPRVLRLSPRTANPADLSCLI